MPSGPVRRSRRTRGERPEIVPPKSDEEPEVEKEGAEEDGEDEEESTDEKYSKATTKRITTRRSNRRGRRNRQQKGSEESSDEEVDDSADKSVPSNSLRTRRRQTRGSKKAKDEIKSGTESSQQPSSSEDEDDTNNVAKAKNDGSYKAIASKDGSSAAGEDRKTRDDEGVTDNEGSDGGGADAEPDTQDIAPKKSLKESDLAFPEPKSHRRITRRRVRNAKATSSLEKNENMMKETGAQKRPLRKCKPTTKAALASSAESDSGSATKGGDTNEKYEVGDSVGKDDSISSKSRNGDDTSDEDMSSKTEAKENNKKDRVESAEIENHSTLYNDRKDKAGGASQRQAGGVLDSGPKRSAMHTAADDQTSSQPENRRKRPRAACTSEENSGDDENPTSTVEVSKNGEENRMDQARKSKDSNASVSIEMGSRKNEEIDGLISVHERQEASRPMSGSVQLEKAVYNHNLGTNSGVKRKLDTPMGSLTVPEDADSLASETEPLKRARKGTSGVNDEKTETLQGISPPVDSSAEHSIEKKLLDEMENTLQPRTTVVALESARIKQSRSPQDKMRWTGNSAIETNLSAKIEIYRDTEESIAKERSESSPSGSAESNLDAASQSVAASTLPSTQIKSTPQEAFNPKLSKSIEQQETRENCHVEKDLVGSVAHLELPAGPTLVTSSRSEKANGSNAETIKEVGKERDRFNPDCDESIRNNHEASLQVSRWTPSYLQPTNDKSVDVVGAKKELQSNSPPSEVREAAHGERQTVAHVNYTIAGTKIAEPFPASTERILEDPRKKATAKEYSSRSSDKNVGRGDEDTMSQDTSESSRVFDADSQGLHDKQPNRSVFSLDPSNSTVLDPIDSKLRERKAFLMSEQKRFSAAQISAAELIEAKEGGKGNEGSGFIVTSNALVGLHDTRDVSSTQENSVNNTSGGPHKTRDHKGKVGQVVKQIKYLDTEKASERKPICTMDDVEVKEDQTICMTGDQQLRGNLPESGKKEPGSEEGVDSTKYMNELATTNGAASESSSPIVDSFPRAVTENMSSPPRQMKKVHWNALSEVPGTCNAVIKCRKSRETAKSKLNRTKMVLYAAGSRVHSGKGFERVFAEYWDAICLHLSDRLSSHTSETCEKAITAFLTSRKLRQLHNRFILGIMREATQPLVPYSKIANHIPLKWEDRIKVKVLENVAEMEVLHKESLSNELEKELLDIAQVPHSYYGYPYKESWHLPEEPIEGFARAVIGEKAHNSSCIPGAIVIDTFLRRIVESRGMKTSDNAMWLLTVSVKQHVTNILRSSIAQKKALKRGEVTPKVIQYPSVLASNGKKEGNACTEKDMIQRPDSARTSPIDSLDILAALQRLPLGQIETLGGSVSRDSMERTFQSSFDSVSPFVTGRNFKDVQHFILGEMLVAASLRKPEVVKTEDEDTIRDREFHTEGSHAPGSISTVLMPTERFKSAAVLQSQRMSPSIAALPSHAPASILYDSEHHQKNSASSPSSSQPQQNSITTAASINNQARPSSHKALEREDGKIRQRPATGAGRGAKNLAALMARAAENKKQEEQLAVSGSADDALSGSHMAQSNDTGASKQSRDIENAPYAATDHGSSGEQKVGYLQKNVNKSTNLETEQRPKSISALNQPGTGRYQSSASVEETQVNNDMNEEEEGESERKFDGNRVGRGKGFGTKNLAAMRARSVPESEDDGIVGDA